jgi:nucleoside-diphosphate-sugar epimerase
VTGGTGFIGINLIELLVSEGWDVTALHRPTSNLDYVKRLPIKLVEGSITGRCRSACGIPTIGWSRRACSEDHDDLRGQNL